METHVKTPSHPKIWVLQPPRMDAYYTCATINNRAPKSLTSLRDLYLHLHYNYYS